MTPTTTLTFNITLAFDEPVTTRKQVEGVRDAIRDALVSWIESSENGIAPEDRYTEWLQIVSASVPVKPIKWETP